MAKLPIYRLQIKDSYFKHLPEKVNTTYRITHIYDINLIILLLLEEFKFHINISF